MRPDKHFFFKDKRIRDKLSWIFQKVNFVYAEIFILSEKKNDACQRG